MTLLCHTFYVAKPTLFSKTIKTKGVDFPGFGLGSCMVKVMRFGTHSKQTCPFNIMPHCQELECPQVLHACFVASRGIAIAEKQASAITNLNHAIEVPRAKCQGPEKEILRAKQGGTCFFWERAPKTNIQKMVALR